MDNTTNFFSQRLNVDYPWLIWAMGWVALLKGVAWLSTDPNLGNPQLQLLGYKYMVLTIPYVICGFGIWQIKKWAVWSLLLLAGAELLFFIFCPFATDSLAINKTSLVTLILSLGESIINGPVSAFSILVCTPFLFRQMTSTQIET